MNSGVFFYLLAGDTTMASTRRASRVFASFGVWALVISTMLVTSCIKEYDMERSEPNRGTLGEELHRIWVQDTERGATNPDERTELLEENERRFVRAVDRTVPEGHVHELDAFLRSTLQVVENGYMPAMSRRIGASLREASEDTELLSSLTDRPPYRVSEFIAPGQRGGTARDAVDYDELTELIAYLAETVQDHDGFDGEQVTSGGGPSSYADLLRHLVDLTESEPPEVTSDRVATALRDILFSVDNRYRIGDDAPREHYIALFDDRGLPEVRRSSDGELPAPFVDNSGDGYPDVDSDGRFILEGGYRMFIPPMGVEPVEHPDLHREPFGRVEISPGRYAFEYVDISDTAAPYLMQMWAKMIDEGIIYDLSQSHRELFGSTVASEDDRGVYQGYPREHPLIDIVDALASALAYEGLPGSMNVSSRYLRRNVDELAFVAYTFGDAAEQLVEYPDADVYSNQTLFHDVLEVLREIVADPELFADVMEALRDPIIERTGEVAATLLEYRDQQVVPVEYRDDVDEDATGEYDECFYECKDSYDIGTEDRLDCIRNCPSGELFADKTEFDEPESVNNRSVFQRIFHLLRDTTGVEYKLEIEELEQPWLDLDAELLPPILTLPGAAEAFLRSVSGELFIGDYISAEFEESGLGALLEWIAGDFGNDSMAAILSSASEFFGFHLDTEPTPDQITRLFNQSNLEADLEGGEDIYVGVRDPRCKDGFVMADHHADGLFAAEASGLIDVIYPLTVAFSRHDREDLLAELFVVVHDHYSAYDDMYEDKDGNPSPMKASNLSSVESPLQQVFEDGQLFEALRTLALTTERLSDKEGVAADERLRQLLHQLIRDDDGYQARSMPQSLELADGRELESPSRLEIILDRIVRWADRYEDDDEVRERMTRVGERFFEIALAAEEVEEGRYEFGEDALITLLSWSLDYLGERAADKQQRGELEPWLTEQLPDGFADFYGSRGLFAANELVRVLQEDENGRALIEEFIQYFTQDETRTDHLAMLLYSVVVATYELEAHMPVGRLILQELDPDRSPDFGPHHHVPTATLLAQMLEKLPEIDPDGYGLELMYRGSQGAESYEPGFAVLLDILVRYFSERPAADEPLTAESWESVFERSGGWLHDDQHGLERYYELIQFRGDLELQEM